MKKLVYRFILTILFIILSFSICGCDSSENVNSDISSVNQISNANGDLENFDLQDKNIETFTNNDKENLEDKSNKIDEKAILQIFNVLIQENAEPIEIEEFLDENIKNLSITSANTLIVGYIKTVEDIDFQSLIKKYGNDIGQDMREYIALLEKRYNLMDIINYTEYAQIDTDLFELIIEYYDFINNNPNSVATDLILKDKDELLDIYFLGHEDVNLKSYRSVDRLKNPSYIIKDARYMKKTRANLEFTNMLDRYVSCFIDDNAVDIEKSTREQIRYIDANNNKFEIRRFFIREYDELFRDTDIVINERLIKGHLYPVFNNLDYRLNISDAIILLGDSLFSKYESKYEENWSKIERYSLPFYDDGRLTVLFRVDIINSKFPELSIYDVTGLTFDINISKPMTFGQLLDFASPNCDKDNIIEKVNRKKKENGFRVRKIDLDYKNCYIDYDGIVLYTNIDNIQNGYRELKISLEEINNWNNEI